MIDENVQKYLFTVECFWPNLRYVYVFLTTSSLKV